MTALATISPTAIDAYVSMEWVRVVGRHRKDLGDLAPLAASIDDVGLLNPVTLTRDGRLIAGQRRLEACRRLGWAEVPVRFADSLDDAAILLRAERDENVCRKEMLLSEKASLGEALFAIQHEEAKERQREHGGTAPGRRANTSEDSFRSEAKGNTRDVVGPALGMSGGTYQHLRYVYNLAHDTEAPHEERALAQEALDLVDQGKSVWSIAKDLRRKLNAKRDAQEAKAAAMADPKPTAEPEQKAHDESWIPSPTDRSPKASEQRRFLIRYYAEQAWTSQQIEDRIGTRAVTVRQIARAEGIPIPADEALGGRLRQTIDSNRIVRETVQDLEGLMSGLDLIRFGDLDPAGIANWTASLSTSIRRLNRLNKQLKEMAQ